MDALYRRFYVRRLRFEPLESRRALSITVDTLIDEDNGVGMGAGTSLREAIAAAASGETIDFSVTGTINLRAGSTSGQLTINKSLTISGPGATSLTIKAQNSRIFNINDGSAANLVDVSLSGLTLTGGTQSAIRASDNLVVTDCVITGNTNTFSGGAIYSSAGATTPNSLEIRNTVITGNAASSSSVGEGGGIRKRYGSLTIENSTISNNIAGRAGGGISVADGGVVVTITGSTFSQNHVTPASSNQGGAIFGANANITVSSSTISGNTAARGGGIYNRSRPGAEHLILIDTLVTGNSALPSSNSSYGGGVAMSLGTLSIIRSTISGNTTGGSGGGVHSVGLLTIADSTISGNSAQVGGGIFSRPRTPASDIVNSTISGNTVTSSSNPIFVARGSGIYNSIGVLTIRSTTITGNTGPANTTAAVASRGTDTTTKLLNSIVAGNINGDVGFTSTTNTLVSLGYNLVGTGNGVSSFNQPGDQTGVTDPMLGPLANNGGPTMTHALLTGSPAIDSGDPAAVAGAGGTPLYDQRGVPYLRVFDGDGIGGGRIDIGAFELQVEPQPAAAYGDYNADGIADTSDYMVWRKTVGTKVLPYTGADGSGNGMVGPEDYDIWRAHFGQTVPLVRSAIRPMIEGGGGSEVVVSRDDRRASDNVVLAAGLTSAVDQIRNVASVEELDARGHLLKTKPQGVAEIGTAGQASSDTRAPKKSDALVGLLLLQREEGERASVGTVQVARDVAGSDDESVEAFDSAFGELVTTNVTR